MTDPTTLGLTTIDAVLAADRLLEAFEEADPEFGRLFNAADRHVLGAVLSYAVLATKGLATAKDLTPADVRHQTRLLVCQGQALIDAQEDNDD